MSSSGKRGREAAELSELMQKCQRRISEVERRISDDESQISHYKRRISEDQSQISQYNRLISEEQSQISHYNRLISELRSRSVQELCGQELPTAKLKEEIEEKIRAIKDDIRELEEKIRAIKDDIREIKEEIREIKKEIRENEEGLEKSRRDRLQVEAELERLVLSSSQASTGSQDSYFKKVKAVGAPSDLSRGDNWRKPQEIPVFLCHIPPDTEPPFPLTLAHPAFAHFVDRFNRSSVEFGSEECVLVQGLCDLVVHKHRNEKEMMQAFNDLLGKYLQQAILPIGVFNYTTDGSLVSETHMVYQSEAKLHEGNSLFQAMHYYALFLSTMEGRKTERTFCPCFLVELVGFHIRISGLAFFEKVACQPFTPFLHCYFNSYDKTDMDSLCRAMLALKRGISELLQYYSPRPTQSPAVDKRVPYFLMEKQAQYFSRIATKLLFLVEMQQPRELRLFKFCKRYGREAHELWAAHGLAPKLFNCQEIAGGWFAVEMEYLSEDSWKSVYQWCNNEQAVDKSELRLAVQNALGRAHELNKELAHGDMRAPNIMAKSVGATFEIKFVDFDWAGGVSSTVYPSFINTEEKWHAHVGPGKCLSQDHDKWWGDKWIQGGTTTEAVCMELCL